MLEYIWERGKDPNLKIETMYSVLNAHQNPDYDAACKDFFRNCEAIAPILQAVIKEYEGYSKDEIIRFIDADTIKEDILVSDLPAKITDAGTEMSSVYEKTVFYDIHFKALNPKLTSNSIEVRLHIDFEVQNEYVPTNPKYPIVKRAIYYAAREISSQLGLLTEKTNYNDLEKIYSIWVCNKGIPKELQNTISKYSFSKTDLLGKTNEPEEDFDLMDIVIIRRGATAPNENDLLQYLEGVFTSDLHKMCKYIDIQENSEMEKEVKSMTGLGQTIAETNYAKGIEKGEESKTKIVVKNLLARGMSDEDIMVLAECSKEMVEQVRNNIE